MKQEKEIGQKFGMLTVVSRAENSKANKRRFNCTCECGGAATVVISKLRSGYTSSCGCLQRAALSRTGSKRLEDLSGAKFGRLTVVERVEQGTAAKPRWMCYCVCGRTCRVSAGNLRSGSTVSCGCHSAESARERLTVHGLSRTPEYMREKNRRRMERIRHVPLEVAKRRARDLIRKSIEFLGYRKNQKTQTMLGCTYEYFRSHIERQFTKGMCWERFGEIHIDHIVPMSTAKTEADAIRLCHYSNLQPLWARDNLSKGKRLDWVNPHKGPGATCA